LCGDIGYRGRRPVIETILSSSKLRKLIIDSAGVDAMRAQAVRDGMRTLQQSALEFVKSGETTLDEIDRALGESARPINEPGDADVAGEAASAAYETIEFSRAALQLDEAEQTGAQPAEGSEHDPGAERVSDLARSLATPSARTPPSSPSMASAGDQVRILVADDDPVIRQIAGSLLAENGFDVTDVEDGVAALEVLNSDHPNDHVDLVISDLDMPRLNGYDLLRLARAAPRTAALPIVVLTSEEEAETEAKLIEEGADDYIRKPIDAVRFVARVKAVLRRAGG